MDAERLVREHKDRVFTLCLRVLGHRQDAEDACQDVLLKVARRPPPPENSEAWVHQVALRTALDLRRSRRRRVAREAGVAAGAPTSAEAAAPEVLEALATLPEEDRAVLLEHFFARKTLRQIADDRGISEPAAWKRVEKGKERLRQVLTATAPALLVFMDGVLEGVEPARALPAAAGAGKTLALVLGALALPLAGVAVWRRPEPAPPATHARPKAKDVDNPPLLVAEPPKPAPAQDEGTSTLPPYPWTLPPRHWSEARRTAWTALYRRRFDIVARDISAAEILADLERRSGVTIRMDPSVAPVSKPITFLVKDLVLWNSLKLLGGQFGLEPALRSDGLVWLTTPELQAVEPDPVFAAAESAHAALERLRPRMPYGGTGIPWDATQTALPGPEIELAPGEYSLAEIADRLRAAGKVNLHISGIELKPTNPELIQREVELVRRMHGAGYPKPSAEEHAAYESELAQLQEELRKQDPSRWVYGGGRRTLKEHLDAVAVTWGGGYAPVDGNMLLCPVTDAPAAWARSERRHAELRSAAERLEGPVAGRPSSVPALAEALEKSTRLRLICSEDVWPERAPSAPTWRELLDAFSRKGIRWVYSGGAVYLSR